ncbi:MAG: hypothetical protein A4E47_00563 [Methanosaeta sp. PtaU1.Bin028]|nr:MAG: hypothetical protein A4E47_00563 [Methanosaeta sp. PtaU1.Bin028]
MYFVVVLFPVSSEGYGWFWNKVSILSIAESVQPGLYLGLLLQVLGVGVHLGQHGADPVVLDAELLDPFLVVGAGLIRDRHVLELGFFGEIDVVHIRLACRVIAPGLPFRKVQAFVILVELPLRFNLHLLKDDVSGPGFLLYQLGPAKTMLSGDYDLNILISNTFYISLFIHIVGSTGCPQKAEY